MNASYYAQKLAEAKSQNEALRKCVDSLKKQLTHRERQLKLVHATREALK